MRARREAKPGGRHSQYADRYEPERGPLQAIVFLTDPCQGLGTTGDILRALYGLTPAESRVALLLGDGHAPPAITGLLGVSVNTLKTQLASIYRKTGTSRQSQLARLMAQLASTAPKN